MRRRLRRQTARMSVSKSRSFVRFDGEGDAANARPRAIGGHPAPVRGLCIQIQRPYANQDGYVPFRTLMITGQPPQRSASRSASDASQIIPMVKDQPTTLYIYPPSSRHRGRGATGEGRRRVHADYIGNLLLQRNPLSEILAKRDPRTDHVQYREGSSSTPRTRRRFAKGSEICELGSSKQCVRCLTFTCKSYGRSEP